MVIESPICSKNKVDEQGFYKLSTEYLLFLSLSDFSTTAGRASQHVIFIIIVKLPAKGAKETVWYTILVTH